MWKVCYCIVLLHINAVLPMYCKNYQLDCFVQSVNSK